jgi:hypothetical protein
MGQRIYRETPMWMLGAALTGAACVAPIALMALEYWVRDRSMGCALREQVGVRPCAWFDPFAEAQWLTGLGLVGLALIGFAAWGLIAVRGLHYDASSRQLVLRIGSHRAQLSLDEIRGVAVVVRRVFEIRPGGDVAIGVHSSHHLCAMTASGSADLVAGGATSLLAAAGRIAALPGVQFPVARSVTSAPITDPRMRWILENTLRVSWVPSITHAARAALDAR